MSTYKIKQIKGFPGYWVDTNGCVWSQRWKRTRKHCGLAYRRKMKLSSQKTGHLYARLRNDGRYKYWAAHRLVALMFMPNLENKPCVCHKDGNPRDNRVENLYWGTKKENTQDMWRHGTMHCGEKVKSAKLNTEKVKLIKLLYAFFDWKQKKIARLFKVDPSNISRIVNNHYWKQVLSNH